MSSPLIDVLIPIYNAAATLEGAIESIQAQTLPDIRILAIDDGSTDATSRLLAKIARNDARIEVLRQPNSGIVDALNLGLAHVTAPIVARHDADDLADPDRFAQQLHYLNSNADCVAVSCFARQINNAGFPTGANAVFPPPDTCDPFWIPSIEPYLLHPFLMARADAIRAIGGYHHVHHAEDTDLYWRLQERGRLHVIPCLMGAYRLSDQSIMSRSLLNGRISAIHSQLAAVAANRRRTGQADLIFEKAAAARMIAARTSENIFSIAEDGLTGNERRFLRAAYAAKLLELSTYRPYKPDEDDSRFIADALKSAVADMRPDNLISVRRSRAIVAATLLRTGEWRAARHLIDVHTSGQAVLRLFIQLIARCLPVNVRRAIRGLRGSLHALKPEH